MSTKQKRRPWSDEDWAECVRLRQEGWTPKQLAEKFGRTPGTISTRFTALRVPRPCADCGRDMQRPGLPHAGRLAALCSECSAKPARPRESPRIACGICGEEFPARSKNVRYCSPRCRREAKRREHVRAYAATLPDDRREAYLRSRLGDEGDAVSPFRRFQRFRP